MTERLEPPRKGEPLPHGEIVFRLAKLPKDYLETGEVREEAFELSTTDSESELKALSV